MEEEELNRKIEAAVVEILRESDMSSTSESMVRSTASKRLGLDLSSGVRKLFVRGIVESFLESQQTEDEEAVGDFPAISLKGEEEESAEQPAADREEEAEGGCSTTRSRRRPNECDDEGDLSLCRLPNKRRVALQDFKGKTLVYIREYYLKDGEELPSSKVVHSAQIILRIVGDCFTPDGHSVAAYISKKFRERQCASGTTWRHVNQDLKDFYYQEFLKQYTWEPGHESQFKKIWNNYCAKLYKDLLFKWRRKGTKPSHVPNEIWDAWKNTWATEKWQQYSSTARNNRNTEVAGPSTGSTKHTAGSRSIVEHAIDLTDILERRPTCWEVFRNTHKKKDGTFVDARSKAIDDEITYRVTQASQPVIEGEELQTPSDDVLDDIYYDVVGGTKKNSIYGLGSQAKVAYERVMAPKLKGRPTSSSTRVKTLEQENKELRDRITAIEQSMEDRVKTLIQQQMQEFIDRMSPNFQTSHRFDSQEVQDPNTPEK
ncbi:uncharacterized protein LOC122045397 isoform X1 [Zingiber officinale]|uniref:uncharacterized protein LOC122045397 isoform X1 n=1 Tax=Zingiber officinale TaxID=94328 RepID=UPI001C4AA2AD|nr:uncharacterized protein LOC122045397 isoform X1 [Zingiber officinale]